MSTKSLYFRILICTKIKADVISVKKCFVLKEKYYNRYNVSYVHTLSVKSLNIHTYVVIHIAYSPIPLNLKVINKYRFSIDSIRKQFGKASNKKLKFRKKIEAFKKTNK